MRPSATPTAAGRWELLAHMRRVMCTRPDVAYAVRCLSLLDQLDLTLEVLNGWRDTEPERPSNVIPFRPRRARSDSELAARHPAVLQAEADRTAASALSPSVDGAMESASAARAVDG